MRILKQAGLPDALTAALYSAYDMQDINDLNPQQLQMVSQQTEVIVTNGEATVSRDFMAGFPLLKLIVVFGVGYDGVDMAAAKARGVQVTHTPGVLTDDVADLAIGLMIAVSRRIVAAQKFIEQGEWQHGGFMWTQKVSGAGLGIVGMGRIGQAVARRAAGFDMQIRYFDRRQREGIEWQYLSDICELARQSDILMVCIPGGEQTRGLIDHRVLEALGPQGILVNIARGTVVDESALIDALQMHKIAAAGLDVYAHEPCVPQALQQQENVVITPHMASATWQTRAEMSRLVMENLRAWEKGWPLVTPVP